MYPEYNEIIRRLKQNDASLTLLDFRQKNLTSEESKEIFKALEENTTVTKLQFLGNNSSGVAAIALSAMLRKNHTIEELELGTNEINNEDIIHIASGLEKNASVTILDLNSNLFDAAKPIADLLEHNNHISEIDLSNSNINKAGFLVIYKALQRNENSSLTAFNAYFTSVSCINDFDNLCRINASRLESTIRLF
ncbi:MAG: hypothetical protein QM652_11925 [Legionella sp.]|uniref:hypothetical protein n=1 Tax=Legionella sp. TaxID=459 RepID=UPI0039E28313